MINELTEEQKAKFPKYVEKWKKIGLSTEPANREKAEEGIRLAYKIAGLKEPKIVWTQSPLGTALTRHVCQKMTKEQAQEILGDSVGASVRASVWDSVWASVRDSVGDSVWASVLASVRDSVRASVRDSVGTSVRDSVWDSVGASVWASVRDSVGDSVWASVWDSVRDSVRDSVLASVRDSVRDSVLASVRDSGYGQHDADDGAFFGFFRNELGLIEQTEKWEGMRKITENAGWYLPHENICWVCERHSTLKTDDRGRLHCEDGPALEYPDGWGIYSWHGIRIPDEWITDKESLTPQTALTWENAEQRRAACEILGWANVLDHPSLNPKIIDTDLPHIGTLIEVDLEDAPKQWFIKYQCGTGRWFAEAVNDKSFNTALKANAGGNGWREGYGDPENFIPSIRT